MGGIVALFQSIPLLFAIVAGLIIAAIVGVILVIVEIIKMSRRKKVSNR
jgi:hypothetical protein